MLSIHKRLHQSFDPSKVNSQHLKNFHNLNGIKTAAESQLESNNHVLKSLKNKLKSVSNETTESEDIEQFTKLDDGFINKHNLPKYISLAKYNDKPFMVPQLKHNLQSTLFSPGSHFYAIQEHVFVILINPLQQYHISMILKWIRLVTLHHHPEIINC